MKLVLLVNVFLVVVFFLLLRRLESKASIIERIVLCLRSIEERCYLHILYRVPELSNARQPNPLFAKVRVYLDSLPSFENDAVPTALLSGSTQNDIVLAPDPSGGPIPDSFLGAPVSWSYEGGDCASLVLRMRKKDKKRILKPYLEKILSSAQEKKALLFHFNIKQNERWTWIPSPFSHPATLDTLVIDTETKTRVKSDLDTFIKSRQYYHKLGRVWKRTYLIYGDAGTGKSSFVAACADFLRFDIFDLDLSSISSDAELKELMMKTTSRSLIVVEGLERYLGERSGVTTAGLASLMDGTIGGEERVMMFTITEGKRTLEEYMKQMDEGVARRFDVKVVLPGCDTFAIFKGLASSYLGVKEHKLFPHIEEILRNGGKLSAAEMGEIMMSNRGSPSRAIRTVMSALGVKPVRPPSVGGEGEIAEDNGAVLTRDSEGSGREIGGLYRLFRGGSRRRTEDPTP